MAPLDSVSLVGTPFNTPTDLRHKERPNKTLEIQVEYLIR